jgi:hypothetical protein
MPAERNAAAVGLKLRLQTVRLLWRDILVLAAADGTLCADDGGKSASAGSVQSNIARALALANSSAIRLQSISYGCTQSGYKRLLGTLS